MTPRNRSKMYSRRTPAFPRRKHRFDRLLRDMEIDYGIIPMPKMDDSQEDYVTYNFGTYYMAILLTAANPEMSAVMLEALTPRATRAWSMSTTTRH